MAVKKKQRKSTSRKPKRRSVGALRKYLQWAALMVAAGIVISILFILPLRWFDPITSAFMLRDDSGRVPPMHIWVDWDRLGSSAPLAAVASEDQRLAEHLGRLASSARHAQFSASPQLTSPSQPDSPGEWRR